LGAHGSQAAQERYREVLTELLAGRLVRAKARVRVPSEWPTIGQLAADFLTHARRFYRDEMGTVSAEVLNFTGAFRVLLEKFATEHVDQFTVRDLSEVRQVLVDSRRYCRKTVNDTIRRCKAIFRWGAEHQIVPAGTWHQLSALRGLTVGRSGVRESIPVENVPWGMVEPILEHLMPPLRAAILLQWHAGLRPTEALRITRGQLDMTNEVWVYRMARHKGSWRGLERTDPAPIAWTRGLVRRQVTSSAGRSQWGVGTENASVHGCRGAARSGALRRAVAERGGRGR